MRNNLNQLTDSIRGMIIIGIVIFLFGAFFCLKYLIKAAKSENGKVPKLKK